MKSIPLSTFHIPHFIKGDYMGFVREQLLTIVQIILCITVIAAAFILKTVGGELYANTATVYFELYNNSVIPDFSRTPLPFSENIDINEVSRIIFGEQQKNTGSESSSGADNT